MATTIRLPHEFRPRPYQRSSLRALDNGATRVIAIWHRRAGKDKTFLNYTIRCMMDKVGNYFYLFPSYAQAKRAIWDNIGSDGKPYLSHFPAEFVKKKWEDELKIQSINGSIFQLIGADTYNSLMSTNPAGCVFGEYALQDPNAWEFFRPILRENKGWAIFPYTPRGPNHGKVLYDTARKLMQEGDPAWFAERLTVDDTGVLTPSDIDAERREGMDEELIQQEFYCSFAGAQQGAIFGKQMDEAERDNRICAVPWQREIAVDTWWDIGTGDATAIWFTQNVGREVHVIDYYENSGAGVGVDHYAKHLQSLPYVWGSHTGPHDLEHHQFAANGKSTKEVAAGLGLQFKVNSRRDKQDGIQAARAFIARCWFDRVKTERGRMALTSYHRNWDDKRRIYSSEPYHDWSSHSADAWQELAAGHTFGRPRVAPTPRRWRPAHTGANSWMGV
jgi:phage terminase large subunit